MTARFAPPIHPDARQLLMSGSVPVGALYPPPGEGGAWRWRMWQLGRSWPIEGFAKTEEAARRSLLTAWQKFLTDAELKEANR